MTTHCAFLRLRAFFAFTVILVGAVAPSVVAGIPTPTNKLYGLITSNRTLTFSLPGPNYQVLGDVVVVPGVTLTIEPGVTLTFAANKDTLEGGSYPNLSELIIQGNLTGTASVNDSIRFLSSQGGAGEWAGILVEGGGTASLQHVAIRGGLNGIQASGNLVLAHATVSASTGFGVVLNSGSVSQCRINDAAYGLQVSGSGSVSGTEFQNVLNGILAYGTGSLTDCIITGRGPGILGTGLYLGGGTSMTPPDSAQPSPVVVSQYSTGVSLEGGTLRNAIIRDNGVGVRLHGGRINYCTIARNSSHGINSAFCYQFARIENSLVTTNGGFGMSLCFYPSSYLDYVDVWSNFSGNYNLVDNLFTPGTNRLSYNPFFVNPTANDFRLDPNSIFYTYSSSGGQLGAYGPGAGLPTAGRTKSWGAVKVRYR